MGFYEPYAFFELASNQDNVFTDTSWQPAGIIRKALDKLGEDRIVLARTGLTACRERRSMSSNARPAETRALSRRSRI